VRAATATETGGGGKLWEGVSTQRWKARIWESVPASKGPWGAQRAERLQEVKRKKEAAAAGEVSDSGRGEWESASGQPEDSDVTREVRREWNRKKF